MHVDAELESKDDRDQSHVMSKDHRKHYLRKNDRTTYNSWKHSWATSDFKLLESVKLVYHENCLRNPNDEEALLLEAVHLCNLVGSDC